MSPVLSIQAQEDSGRAWAAREGYLVRKVWIDNLSAWSDVERPEFDKALAAVLEGEVPALWCAYLDRFTRKGIDDIGPILGKARVIFDYDGLDSSNERDACGCALETEFADGDWTETAPHRDTGQ
ncbi:recombinase family protein [Kitasatospora aureofaciens]|uniref:recombinase family protein n=1 Tax=Kitasatospora aureofaciens TaxID=1894 RepID=UPI001E109F1E|nr:recombinase family protein [Kitasatospora aureofaciens]HJD85315.1 recombinase family protein [Kitasatospora aureofaciens]